MSTDPGYGFQGVLDLTKSKAQREPEWAEYNAAWNADTYSLFALCESASDSHSDTYVLNIS